MKRIIFSLTALFFGIAAAVFGAELALRCFPKLTGVYATANQASPRIYTEDRGRGYALLPNATAAHRSLHGDFSVTYHINAQGLRGTGPYGTKQARRIMLLGDSFILGIGVRDDQTLSRALEDILNKEHAAGGKHPYELIGAGAAGYTFDNEYMTLKAFAHLAPDIVLVGACLNDVTDLAFHKWVTDEGGDILGIIETARHIDRYHRFVNGPKELYHNSGHLEGLLEFCRNYSFLYNVLGTLRFRNQSSADIRNAEAEGTEARRKENLERALEVLGRMRDFCSRRRIEFAIFSVDPYVFRRYPKLKENRFGIRAFDISGLYEQEDKLVFPHDRHWSPEGTRIVARWLAGQLRKAGMIERKRR